MEEAWAGTVRFEVRRRLGAGASGTVYEVRDRKLDAIVALKALSRRDPTHLYLFKQEFRELADMHHPHLVTLYELEEDAGRWFFTMELVRGEDFLAHVRRGAAWPAPRVTETRPVQASTATTLVLGPDRSGESGVRDAPADAGAQPLDDEGHARLRAAMPQLAEGVVALHRARKLHRDLKPSNVRVEPGGRVVLLDFGLVLPLQPDGVGTSMHIAGTPTYMAPEQALGLRISEASDWYAVGVMLYQALTGRAPFAGVDRDALLYAKQSVDPPPPGAVVAGVPPDLDALCMALLRRDPARRPTGDEVLARLRGDRAVAVRTRSRPSDGAPPFVGRRAELARIEAAYERTRRGLPAVVWLRGPSGIGKSRLAQTFLDGLVANAPESVVLTGRCYQQESVPFEGLDSVVDALCRFLGGLPDGEVDAYLPREVVELGRLFPVLRQVSAIGEVPSRATVADQVELRRRAFAALRELLRRIAERRPLVVAIEDLQWGGEDSGALLAELLQPPDAPAMLVLGTVRDGDADASPMLRHLGPELDRLAGVLHRDEVRLQALPSPDARALAASIVGTAADALLSRIAQESEGNPFFLCALARHQPVPRLSLDEVIDASVARVAPAARALLAVVCVAGRPLDEALALRAAHAGEGGAAAIAELRSAHLIRLRSDGGLEAYHDRIRDGMLARLDEAATAETHQRIADELESSGRGADPEHLVGHLVGAGARRRAAPYAVEAARRAAEALAFERASVLYRLALSLESWDPLRKLDLTARLSEALANAGRGTSAGQAYLQAARLAGGDTALELRRRAAEQLLMSGRIDEGTQVLRSVLASVGLGFPRSQLGTLLSVLWQNLKLRLRALRYRERREEDVPSGLLRRIDACWTVCHGLAGASPLHSMAFVARGALLALRAGEPSRIANFLALHATLVEALAPGTMSRELDVARSAAARTDSEYSRVFNEAARAAGLYFAGRVQEYVAAFGPIERLLRERCRGVAWELLTFQSLADFARTFLGDWRTTAQMVHTQVREAEQRGDLYGAATLAMALGWVRHLADDRPQAALRELDEYLGRWGTRAMHYQHFYDCETRAYVHMYMGDARAALEYVDRRWSALRRAGLMRVQVVHTLLLATRISSLVAASYERGVDRRALLRRARRDVRTMRALPYEPAADWGLHLFGCVLLAEGDREGAIATLEEAGDRMRASGYRTGPVTGDLLRGELVGGDEGATLVASALDYFRAQGFRDPRRFARLFAPGPA